MTFPDLNDHKTKFGYFFAPPCLSHLFCISKKFLMFSAETSSFFQYAGVTQNDEVNSVDSAIRAGLSTLWFAENVERKWVIHQL